ncbi:MAG: hypothetical protein V3R34_02060 [Hyphomicrobium sp.]
MVNCCFILRRYGALQSRLRADDGNGFGRGDPVIGTTTKLLKEGLAQTLRVLDLFCRRSSA